MKQLTLVIVTNGNRILLGMKKRGFGAGLYNGFGGKVEPGETIEEAAKRELWEEVGIVANELSNVGQLEFVFADESPDLLVHLFLLSPYEGEVTESEEMKPEWYTFDTIPYSQMWPDDEFWVPEILAGNVCQGRFVFDTPSTADYTSVIIENQITVAKELSELDLKV
jgi:mutator protein MutT